MAEITTAQVWDEIEEQLFAVLAMVSASGEARSVGIVYIVRNRRLYIGTDASAWKVRHVQRNSNVSMTIPIHRSIPLLPWIKIPAATITFSGVASVHEPSTVDSQIVQNLFRGLKETRKLTNPLLSSRCSR